MARGAGFGTAFTTAFAAMLRAIEDERHNRALEEHWARLDGKGFPTDVFNAGRAGASPYMGGAGGSTSKNLGANQAEAYKAAKGEGLSDNAARALVANMSGESLANPGDVHKDPSQSNPNQMAHGIVSWDDPRAAAIQKQFRKMPNEMSVAEQTKAAIWEMKTNPAYKASWDALNSNASPQDMVKALVTNYERPANPDVAINQRLQHLGNLSTDMGATKEAGAAPTKGPLAGKTPKTAEAATPLPTNQVAGGTDEDAMRIAIEENKKLAENPLGPRRGAEVTAPLGGGVYDPRTIDPTHTSYVPDAAGNLGPPPTGAPPNVGITPSSVPPSPASSAPQMGPEGGGRTTLPDTPLPPPRPATEADKPTPSAQSVSSPAIPPQPAQNSRYVQIDAPNQDPTARGPARQMTAVNLWGANPPVAQRQAITPQSNPRRDDTPAPNMDDAALGQQLGYAAGGAVTAFMGGGSTSGSGGGTNNGYNAGNNTNAYVPWVDANHLNWNQQQQIQQTQQSLDSMLYGSGAPYSQDQINQGSPTMEVGDMMTANLKALSPEQQKWYNSTSDTLGYASASPAIAGYFLNQLTPAPAAPAAAAPAAAAPAVAPAPAIAPTIQQINPTVNTLDPSADNTMNKTNTGGFKLPDTVTPKTPSYISPTTGMSTSPTGSQNKGGTNYSVGVDDSLRQNNTTGGSYARGGAISKTAYDDGGAVSPSALGVPPGLGGQGAIPPIYYNSATYSAAGAPVGKGVTQNSAGTTVAGAIPALPMAKGGAVGFADGGTVDEYTGEDTEGGVGPATGNARGAPVSVAAPPPAAPQATTQPITHESNYATAQSPQDVHPDLPAWTPQVKDEQGNPSQGVIGAISGGLKYLASQLGLSGGGRNPAVAGDPATQANRQSFSRGEGVPGAPVPSQAEVTTLHSAMGASGLTEGMRNLAGMEAVRNYYLVNGDPTKADQMAASMMQYSVSLAQQHGDEAAKRYYDGDLRGAVQQLNHASDALGSPYKAELAPDGTHVVLSEKDLNGREVWKSKVAPQEILGAALGMKDGSLAWHSYEAQAAKYDPVTAQMLAERRQQNTWTHQQEVLDQKDKAKQDAADESARIQAGVLQRMHGGTQTVTPQGNIPAPPNAQQGAIPSGPSAPETAATSPAPAPAPATPTPVTPPPVTQGAIPSTPSADMPAPATQNVDAEQPSLPEPKILPDPTLDPDWPKMKPAEQASVRKDYDQSLTAHQQWQTEQAKLAYEGRSAARTQSREDSRAARTSAAAATTETNRENFERQKEASAREWDLAKPRDRAETAAAFNTTPNESGVASGKEPTTYIAEAMGYVKADGTPDIDMVNKNFSRDEQPIIAQAMMNGYHYSPGTSAPMITKAITGALTDPSYIMHKTEISPDKVYGFPRYSISVEHKGTGTSTSFVLPVEDYNNLKALYNNRQQAAAKNAPAPASAPAPTGAPAPAIPSTPYKPLVSGPMFRTPQWVPPEQMPPDQRAMYPELNQ